MKSAQLREAYPLDLSRALHLPFNFQISLFKALTMISLYFTEVG